MLIQVTTEKLDNALFEDWVQALDSKFLKENKKITLKNQHLSSPSKNWQPFQCLLNIFTSKHHVSHLANGSRGNKVLKGSLPQTLS